MIILLDCRHVYKPMLSSGYTKIQGVLTVFLLSAAFHEVICIFNCETVENYGFSGVLQKAELMMYEMSNKIAMGLLP